MIGSMAPEVAEAFRSVAMPREVALAAVTSPGSSLILTSFRLIVVREGRSFRPRNGIRSWGLTPTLRLEPRTSPHGAGSLLLGRGRNLVSIFVAARDWDDAMALVYEARRLCANPEPSAGRSSREPIDPGKPLV